MKAYKLFRVKKNGAITSLFINKTKELPLGEWVKAIPMPTKGYAFREGWHCLPKPNAPHLSMKDRQWFLVEIDDYKEINRPESQGGTWYISKWIKILRPEPNPELI